MSDAAISAGIRPSAVRFILRDAGDVFRLEGATLVPSDGRTDRGDPLVALSFRTWLEELRGSDRYLFTK